MRKVKGETLYYPDVVIAPSPARLERDRGTTLLDPLVVFEVISPTTEGIDRGEKLAAYGAVPTVSDYLLIAQTEMRIDHLSRQPDGSWRLVLLRDPAEEVRLPAIGVTLPLAEIYDRIFPATA